MQDFIAELSGANEGETPHERLLNFPEEMMLDSDREEEDKEAGDADHDAQLQGIGVSARLHRRH